MSIAPWLVTALAVVSPMLTIARSVPQAVRVRRIGAEGVSATTWLMLLALSELWAVYGVLARVANEVATNIPNGLLCLVVVVLVARRRQKLLSTLAMAGATSAAVAVLTVACVLAHAPSLESVVAMVGSLALYLPQLVTALRSKQLAGLSVPSWGMAFLAAVSWGAYGLAIRKVPVYLPTVVMAPSAFLIVVRAMATKRAPGPAAALALDR